MKRHQYLPHIGSMVLAAALTAGWLPSILAAPEKAAYLGVLVTGADETLRNQVKLPYGVGLNVMEVIADSPADKGGIKTHDVLEKLDDQLLFNGEQLSALVRTREPGDKVKLSVIRQGDRQTVEVTLGETELVEPPKPAFEDFAAPFRDLGRFFKDMPDRFRWEPFLGEKGQSKPFAYLGVELGPVEPALASQLDLDEGDGALVNTVLEDSPADKAGLKKHDIIVRMDSEAVRGPEDLSKRIREHKKGDEVKIELLRGGKKMEIKASLSERRMPEVRRLGDALKSVKELQHRLVPRVRVLGDPTNKRETVIELEVDGDQDGEVAQGRAKLNRSEPPELGRGRVLNLLRSKPPKPPVPPKVLKGTFDKRFIVIETGKDTTTVRDENGQRFVTVRDEKNNLLFDGPVGSAADREKLPVRVRERLERIEQQLDGKGAEGLLEEEVHELRIPAPPLPPGVI